MRQEKILIVEDEAIISMVLEETLQGLGYGNIQTALDEETALEKIRNDSFDLLLMDINLGGGRDGIDIIRAIRQENINVPFVYVSSYSDFKTITKAKYTQPEGYIIKPINDTDLMILLELIFYKKSLQSSDRQGTQAPVKNKLLDKLTKKELDVLNYIVMGLSNKMIADVLSRSEKTVSVHRANIMKKMDARNAADLVRIVVSKN